MLGTSAPATLIPQQIPAAEWSPALGDVLLVNTQANEASLVQLNGNYTSFKVVTGQRGVVSYIGRRYNATTPTKTWHLKSKHIKGDRITFGKTGEFLRLYNDDSPTPYGVHPHAYSQKMLADDDRFRSMGCVIVADDIFRLIDETFAINNGIMKVVTFHGVPNPSIATAENLQNAT
jgi:hypothetical protein